MAELKLKFGSLNPEGESCVCFERWIPLEHQYCLEEDLWDFVADDVWVFLGVHRLVYTLVDVISGS